MIDVLWQRVVLRRKGGLCYSAALHAIMAYITVFWESTAKCIMERKEMANCYEQFRRYGEHQQLCCVEWVVTL